MLSQSPTKHPDYYSLLGVRPEASQAEIKRAYRTKIKENHPDLTKSSENAGEKVREIIKAYRTLVDPELRRIHDMGLPVDRFSYRDFLKEQGGARNMACLIFFDLLHEREDEACKTYIDQLPLGFLLSRELEREDYMDCGFILAEELTLRNQPVLAFSLLQDIINLELGRPYFRHFFPEVLELMNRLIDERVRYSDDNTLIDWIESIVSAGLPSRESAIYLKKAAEIYLERNQMEKAVFYMEECRRLFKNLPGLSDLEKRLALRNKATWRVQ